MTIDDAERPDRNAERLSVSPPGTRARFVMWTVVLAIIAVSLVRAIPKPNSVDVLAEEPLIVVVPVVLLVVAVGVADVSRYLIFGFLPGLEQVGRSIAIDANGIWYIQKRKSVLLPWRDVAGVGIVEDRDSKFMFVIEIYLHDAVKYSGDKLVSQWLVDESVSHSGMPRQRLAFTPIRIGPIRDTLVPAIWTVARQAWVGGRPYGSSQRVRGT